jgi:Na+/proline symporter
MLIFLLYALIIIAITYIQRKNIGKGIFRTTKKVSWWISGVSLYMLYLSAEQGQLLAGIITQQGMQGMWMVWASCLGAFVVPLVFAPFWQKLDFITDNQFLLFRFPGKSGKALHLFRAIYVGGLVVSILICFHILGFSRVIQTYFELDPTTSVILTGTILCLFALKNIFDIKLKIDILHFVLYIMGTSVILYSVHKVSNGEDSLRSFFEQHPEKKQLFPSNNNTSDWFSLLVFIGIQWWSCSLFDGGGPEMARFTATKDKKNSIRSGLFPIFISIIMGFLMVGQIVLLLGVSPRQESGEILYVERIFQLVPEALKSIVLLGFFGMFITSAESLMNWGASFLTIDAYKTYFEPQASEKKIRTASFMVMILLAVLSTFFALQIDSLQSLMKITFSIAAGVAPVYILRWVWFRINAWSQISAMFSSAICTLIYPEIHQIFLLSYYPMEESRVVVVTIITTFIWLITTFATHNHSEAIRLKMMPVIENKKNFLRQFVFALSLGFLLLLVSSGVWYFLL